MPTYQIRSIPITTLDCDTRHDTDDDRHYFKNFFLETSIWILLWKTWYRCFYPPPNILYDSFVDHILYVNVNIIYLKAVAKIQLKHVLMKFVDYTQRYEASPIARLQLLPYDQQIMLLYSLSKESINIKFFLSFLLFLSDR